MTQQQDSRARDRYAWRDISLPTTNQGKDIPTPQTTYLQGAPRAASPMITPPTISVSRKQTPALLMSFLTPALQGMRILRPILRSRRPCISAKKDQ